MAETSGFMTDLPQSAYLSQSIKRAISAAQQRSHRYVTLEHLMLALLDDPGAIEILEGLRADIPGIRTAISDTVTRNLATLHAPGEFDLRASYKVERVLQTASDDAERLGCEELDAAFVIAALSRESDNPVPGILKQNGVSYASAVTWLYANRGTTISARFSRPNMANGEEPAPAKPVPPQSPAEAEASADLAEEGAEPEATLEQALEEVEAAPADEEAEEEPLELDLEVVEDAPEERPASLSERAASVEETFEAPAEPAPVARNAQPQPQSQPVPPRAPEPDRNRHDQAVRFPAAVAPAPPAPRPAPGRIPTRPDADQGWRDDGPPARAIQRRPEPKVPPPSRLDEMRLGKAQGRSAAKLPVPAPAPSATVPAKKKSRMRKAAVPAQEREVPAAERQRARPRRRPRPYEVIIGRLIENVPRRMRAAIAERIEVRISREETKALARGMEGRSEPVRHELMITQTMSVALRAPDGGFTIEPLSPETQWIFERPDDTETYGRWRWVVTPHEPGRRRLQLVVAARSIGQNGLVGDTALPDQIITIRVRTNYWRSLARGLQWIAAMMVGGVLTELAAIAMRLLD